MESKPLPTDAAAEIESLRHIVEKHFDVYEMRLNADTVSFACEVDKLTLDQEFRGLKAEISSLGYTPVITHQKGEYTITIGKLPPIKSKGIWINVVLLIATIATTVFAGMELWASYSGDADSLLTAETALMGALTFALPLMAILGVHEMSHYFAAKRHGVPASLPFFIPAPFLFIGTFGAFISIRGPIPDRRSLFDLGISGPIAGFLAAIPVAILGTVLTTSGAVPVPAETGGAISISMPIIYQMLSLFIPTPDNMLLHPTAMAGWVGFLVTAINLLPAGSLDGGHIARAVFGPKYRYASWASILVLLGLGMFLYSGWLIFALLILFLGTDHNPPLNDITPISVKRKAVSLAIVAILVSCFAIVPMEEISPDHSIQADIIGGSQANVSVGMNHTFTIHMENSGNLNTTVAFAMQPENISNSVSLRMRYRIEGSVDNVTAHDLTFVLPVKQNATAYLTMLLLNPIQQGSNVTGDMLVSGNITIANLNAPSLGKALPITILQLAGDYSYSFSPASLSMGSNQTKTVKVNVTNDYFSALKLKVTLIAPAGWSAWAYDIDPANATSRLNVTMNKTSEANFTIEIRSPPSLAAGDSVIISIEFIEIENQKIKMAEIQITTV